MLRNTLFCIGMLSLVGTALAQDKDDQEVIYKWKKNGLTHYTAVPPRGAESVVRLDSDGEVIASESDDMKTYEALRPMRPKQRANPQAEQQHKVNQNEDRGSDKDLPPGAITREERCEKARQDIQTIRDAGDKRINVEDANGDLIPMSDEQKQQRLKQAQALIDRLCKPQS